MDIRYRTPSERINSLVTRGKVAAAEGYSGRWPTCSIHRIYMYSPEGGSLDPYLRAISCCNGPFHFIGVWIGFSERDKGDRNQTRVRSGARKLSPADLIIMHHDLIGTGRQPFIGQLDPALRLSSGSGVLK